MNFIAKHIQWIGVLLLTVFAGAAAGLYFGVPRGLKAAEKPQSGDTCPMHIQAATVPANDSSQCTRTLVTPASESAAHTGCAHIAAESGCCGAPEVSKNAAGPEAACPHHSQATPAADSQNVSR